MASILNTMIPVLSDLAVRLAPAATIVGAIIAGRSQLKNNRKINAEMIAKNHFRQMLQEFSRKPKLLFAGMTDPALAELRKDPNRYREYALMYAACMFAMQEVFQAIDLNREKNWASTIRNFCSLFKPFMNSEGIGLQTDVDQKFLNWVRNELESFDHPFARKAKE